MPSVHIRAVEIAQFPPETAPVVPDASMPAYRYAKALVNSARSAATKISSFAHKWNNMRGRDQWDVPRSRGAQLVDQWSFHGVCNWTYSTIKTKAAMITGATAEIFVEPLGDESTYLQRLQWKATMEHLLEEVRFDQVKRDTYINGAVTGVGIAMWQVRPDPLTEQERLYLTPIKSEEFYCDPSADSITSPNCRFVVWEPTLDMSTIRQMWPSKADKVKVDGKQITGGFTYSTTGDSNLIYGNSGEFYIDQQNVLCSRKAKVCFVWIVDESLTEDVEKVLIKQGGQGYACVSCGEVYRPADYPGANCPTCQGYVGDYQIPDEFQENKVFQKQYPFGRLIIYSSDVLLYDGPNQYEIETVFPFAVYHHARIPGDFYGENDVDLLASLQKAENTVLSMGVDGVVLSMFGPFEYPVGCKSYTEIGNGPKERHPVPDHLAGKARFVPPSGADMNLWNGVLQAIHYQFSIQSGLGQIGSGQISSPPISATEAEIANARLSDRMKGESEEFGQFCTDVANIGKQLAKQFYGKVNVSTQFPDSILRTMEVEVSQLPDVNIRIVIDHQMALRDKQIGQNVAMGLQQGILDSPNAPIFLESVGVPANRIREIMEQKALDAEIAPPGAMNGAPPPPQPGGMNGELQPQ